MPTKVHCQPNLVGNWKFENRQEGSPNLIINADSTFFIQFGRPDVIMTFSGNPIDDEFKGVWNQPDSNHLTLWSDSKSKMFFPFKIISLTMTKLIVRFTFQENEKQFGSMTFIRL